MDKTKSFILKYLDALQAKRSRYFMTVSGSTVMITLALNFLASEILYRIVRTPTLPINVFQIGQEQTPDGIFINDNALVTLVDNEHYDLYNLLFNRLIESTANYGIGGLSCVTDALIRLQVIRQKGNVFHNLLYTRLLKKCIRRDRTKLPKIIVPVL